MLGGALGVLAGYAVARIGEYAAAYYGIGMLKPAFPWWLMLGCLLFAFIIGGGAGLLPAVQAARQKPVEALRYE